VGFGKEAIVEGLVFLKLDFGEEDNARGCIVWGQKHAINAKGGFFDFDGFKAIMTGF
jgi:hypothetical protein